MASGGGDCGGGLSRVRTAERGAHVLLRLIENFRPQDAAQ